MAKMSIRLAPEICKKLEQEARRLSQMHGKTVTVSELIRACILEKFPQVCARAHGETDAVIELREEVFRLSEHHALFGQDVQKLVQTLEQMFQRLATREQVKELTESIVEVIKAVKAR